MGKENTKKTGTKEEALEQALKQIEKSFGKGSIMKLGDNKVHNIEAISTGCMSLDMATGIGGIPKGRIIEVYGPESSGKTTLALHILSEAQKDGGTAAFIDAEHALDPEYAKNLGVNLDELLVSQPDNGEEALEICEMLVRSGAVDIIIVDSVAALVPKAEITGSMGDSHVGLHARLMSQALRKLAGAINKSNATVVFINQLREKVGQMYGNPEVTTGGRALKFYASMRIEVRKADVIKKGDEAIGNKVRIKIVKNKVAPPFKMVMVDIMYGEGISKLGDLIDVAAEHDVIKKAGSWYSFEGEKIGQGRENVKLYLKEHPELEEIVKKLLLEKLKNDEIEIKSIADVSEDEDKDVSEITDPIVDEDGVILD